MKTNFWCGKFLNSRYTVVEEKVWDLVLIGVLKDTIEGLKTRHAQEVAALTQANNELREQTGSKQTMPRRNTAIGAYGMNASRKLDITNNITNPKTSTTSQARRKYVIM